MVNQNVASDQRKRSVPSGADRLLAQVVRHGGPWAGAMAVTSLATAGAETVLPAVLGRSVDGVLGRGGAAVWLAQCGLLVAVLVACDALDDLAAGASTARSTAWLRHALVGHVLDLGTRASRKFTAGDLTGRLVGNAAEAGRSAPAAVWAAANLIPAAGGIAALALIDPWLCITFLAGLPVLTVLLRAFARNASDLATRYFQAQGEIAARLVDALAGARTIAAAGTVDQEARRVLGSLPELHRHGTGSWRAQGRMAAQQALLVPLLEVAVLAVAGRELAAGRITPGELFAASQYVLLGTGVSSAVTSVAQLTRARAGAARAVEVLAEPPAAYGTQHLPSGRGRLEFRGISVYSGGEPVLNGLDLVVPEGTLAAVVGRSGAGKSVLAMLAGRLADPDRGEVLLDGVPLHDLDRRELRQAVTYGFESPVLIGETIADAICFGEHTPARGQMAAAARAAQADAFIRRIPEGYQRSLASAPMSGGEAQRVGLARAFAHAGRVLILDDVAASLDTVTEHHISQVLTSALSDRTRLVIARRASTAARADQVVWLDGGRVRAVGPHHELWDDPDYRGVFGPTGASGGFPQAGGSPG